MNEREKEIVRLALIYLQANRDDACEAFASGGFDDDPPYEGLAVNGEPMDKPTEEEIEQCLKLVQ